MPNTGTFDAEVNNQISRYDFAQIIACKRDLCLIRPVRLVYSSATGLLAGTVLARYTSGPNTGLFDAYNDSGASGLGTAQCILLFNAQPASGDTVAAPALFKGIVFTGALIGLDTAAVTDFVGRKFTDASGVELLSF